MPVIYAQEFIEDDLRKLIRENFDILLPSDSIMFNYSAPRTKIKDLQIFVGPLDIKGNITKNQIYYIGIMSKQDLSSEWGNLQLEVSQIREDLLQRWQALSQEIRNLFPNPKLHVRN